MAAEWRVQAGQEEAVRQHEPGNLLYIGHQDPADATHFLFYEQYDVLTDRTITFY